MNWILLRGLGRDREHWGRFHELMAEVVGTANIHCIDLPGSGDFHERLAPLFMRAYTRHVVEQARDITPPYSVIGLSLGGMVAIDWAQSLGAERITRLVLINTSSRFSPFYQRARFSLYRNLPAFLLQPAPETRERRTLAITSNMHADDTELLAQWIDIQTRRPVSRMNLLRQLIAASRFRPADRAPGCQGLILTSRMDRLVNPNCSETLAERWNWPMEMHPSAGHDLPLDDPEWVIDKIGAKSKT